MKDKPGSFFLVRWRNVRSRDGTRSFWTRVATPPAVSVLVKVSLNQVRSREVSHFSEAAANEAEDPKSIAIRFQSESYMVLSLLLFIVILVQNKQTKKKVKLKDSYTIETMLY